MREGVVRVINPLGLHARAAAQVVRLAGKYNSRIILARSHGAGSANALSILGILTLAAPNGTDLTLRVEGEDEEAAFSAIVELFGSGFGEI
jgi:phosphocarrier protein HPr